MFWARMGANAVRAISAGMGHMAARRPPPFYAYDADIGRLAVSSPHYSTAILAVNRGKVPYGGIELARLYDADGDPIGGTGGHPPSSFGVLIDRVRGGRRVLSTQTGLHADPRRPPIILTHSPRGRVTRQKRLATHPDAGPFSTLDEAGTRSAGGVQVSSRYRFRSSFIQAGWTVVRSGGGGSGLDRVRITFPTSARTGAVIEAVRRDGTTVVLTQGARPRLADVREFRLRSSYGSYVVQLLGHPTGTLDVLARRPQRANPRGGPTLALELPAVGPGGRRRLTVRIVPSSDGGTSALETEPAPSTTPFPAATPTVSPTPADPPPGG
jgi:hypothetical protein